MISAILALGPQSTQLWAAWLGPSIATPTKVDLHVQTVTGLKRERIRQRKIAAAAL